MAQNSLTVPANPARALRDLNRQPPVVTPPAEGEIGEEDAVYTTILQSNKPTNRLTDKQTHQQTDQPTNKQAPQAEPGPEPAARPARVDGRTRRVRQETADPTTVTSMRLAVSTLEALDEHCYRYRKRKQDVVQAALDAYFAAVEAQED